MYSFHPVKQLITKHVIITATTSKTYTKYMLLSVKEHLHVTNTMDATTHIPKKINEEHGIYVLTLSTDTLNLETILSNSLFK